MNKALFVVKMKTFVHRNALSNFSNLLVESYTVIYRFCNHHIEHICFGFIWLLTVFQRTFVFNYRRIVPDIIVLFFELQAHVHWIVSSYLY